jgi:hypothetical protein
MSINEQASFGSLADNQPGAPKQSSARTSQTFRPPMIPLRISVADHRPIQIIRMGRSHRRPSDAVPYPGNGGIRRSLPGNRPRAFPTGCRISLNPPALTRRKDGGLRGCPRGTKMVVISRGKKLMGELYVSLNY